MPALINNNHWIFFQIDFNNKIIFYYDSYWDDPASKIGRCKFVSGFISSINNDKNLNFYPAIMDCPYQSNADDCGIYLLKQIEKITLEFCCFPIEMNISDLRLFALQLMKNKIYI